jgi:hypothetical protein
MTHPIIGGVRIEGNRLTLNRGTIPCCNANCVSHLGLSPAMFRHGRRVSQHAQSPRYSMTPHTRGPNSPRRHIDRNRPHNQCGHAFENAFKKERAGGHHFQRGGGYSTHRPPALLGNRNNTSYLHPASPLLELNQDGRCGSSGP